MYIVELKESHIEINPLAIAYIDSNLNNGAKKGFCKVYFINGQVIEISGNEVNQILDEITEFNAKN